jgi:hypothetical protein
MRLGRCADIARPKEWRLGRAGLGSEPVVLEFGDERRERDAVCGRVRVSVRDIAHSATPGVGDIAHGGAGAYPSPPARRPGTRRTRLPVTDAELAHRHHQHTSLNALAAEYHTSPQTIRRRINAHLNGQGSAG